MKRRGFRLPPRRPEDLFDEMDDEIRHHLELRASQLMASGWDADAAQEEALRRFGPLTPARRSLYREARGRQRRMRLRERLDSFRQDLSLALRTLRREPGFSLVVVITMALGIGANAAMFGIVDRLLLRGPDHVRDADEVVRITQKVMHPRLGERRTGTFGYVTYVALRDGAGHVFDGVAAAANNEAIIGLGVDAERIRKGSATHDFFAMLGVQPVLGRFFDTDEDRPPRGQNVVVLSHGLFERRFGGDPSVLGETLILGGASYTIIGVAPAGFTGAELQPVDLWIPMSAASHTVTDDWHVTWGAQWLQVFARLDEGVTPQAASEAAMSAWRNAYTADDPLMGTSTIEVASLDRRRDGAVLLEASIARWLVGVAFIVLLVACANVANLYLARAARRRRDIAVRLALGIGQGRLTRMLLTETLLLAMLGAGTGLLLTLWGGGVLRALLLPDVAWTASPLNARVVEFTLALTVLTALATGLLPALFAGTRDLTHALRSGPRAGGGRRSRARAALTIAQASLSMVLLVAAGIFVRSLWNALNTNLGIDPDRVQTVDVFWPPVQAQAPGFSTQGGMVGERARSTAVQSRRDFLQSRRDFFLRALESVRSLPGIENAAIGVGTPFHSSFGVTLRVPGHDSIPELPGGGPYVSAVTADYFATVGTRLLRGRVFEASEGAGTEAVTIINETMARTLWPDSDPIGHCIYIGDPEDQPPCARIVGIVEEATRFSIRVEPAMQYYVPFGQERGFGGMLLLFRPSGDASAPVEAVRRELQQLDTRGGYISMRSLREAIEPRVRPWRLGATLFSLFGILALVIAAIGLYSVIAYSVAERTHELGVRMALGARRVDVRRMVLRQGLSVALIGGVLGAAIALATGRFAEPLLFDVSPRDPLIFAVVGITLIGAAVLASVLPAARATRVEPLVALRAE